MARIYRSNNNLLFSCIYHRIFAAWKPQGFSPWRKRRPSFPIASRVDWWYTNNMKREYQHNRHRVHLVLYHLIWCPKRRRPILVGEVAERLDTVLREAAQEKGWAIEHLAIQPDHLHLFIQGNPTTPAHKMVRLLKGRSAHHLRKEFPHLLRLPSLWTRSYFCSTAGNVSAATIQRYIDAQKGL